MPTFFIILIFTYLGGNAYIFYRGLQTLSGFPYGIKILLTILFWLAALSFFGTMLSRNVKIPFYLSHTMYEGRDRLADIHFIYGLVFTFL